MSGSGDDIVDIDNPFEFGIVHIVGNANARYFGVESYDTDGNQVELLVNTTDPYDGIRPLDFGDSDHTTRFVVTSSGPWTIEVLPITSARILEVPGYIEGYGDDVILLVGEKPDIAIIKGNNSARYFGVFSYGKYYDLLVNTTDPYDGKVIIRGDALIIEVIASDSWSIEVTD